MLAQHFILRQVGKARDPSVLAHCRTGWSLAAGLSALQIPKAKRTVLLERSHAAKYARSSVTGRFVSEMWETPFHCLFNRRAVLMNQFSQMGENRLCNVSRFCNVSVDARVF